MASSQVMGGRELAEVAALLVALGFSALVFTELSDRLRRRVLKNVEVS